MAVPAWRLRLQPASFNGVAFHIDDTSRASGRRIALKEFPKKNIPYGEDMGRRAKRFTIKAYVIGDDYTDQRDALIEELEAEGPGILVHPTYVDYDQVNCENYSVTERRERGGIAEFEITFSEAGQDPSTVSSTDTQSGVSNAADTAADTGGAESTASGTADLSALSTAQSFINSGDISGLLK